MPDYSARHLSPLVPFVPERINVQEQQHERFSRSLGPAFLNVQPMVKVLLNVQIVLEAACKWRMQRAVHLIPGFLMQKVRNSHGREVISG